ARLAERENQADLIAGVDLTHEDQDVANILIDLTMRDTMNQSKFLANTVVDAMQASHIKTLQNPHRFAGFAVLKAPDIPSVLVEVGFLSNSTEAKLLGKPAHRRKIASSIRRGVDQYFDTVNRNRRS
ncbi:N-acetylmuramoyl-L-alanine amidase, partial [Anaplasma marginale]|uniref:N-acetylmuramoyl-L-alanine amidase n=1 Tax=Anaplasma marginale TaxID=770 RepID=UPI0005B3C779